MMLIENRRFLTVMVSAAMGVMTPATSQAATTFTVNPPADRTDGTAKGVALWCDRAVSATQGRVRCAAANVHIRAEDVAAALRTGKVDLICIAHKTDPLRYKISRIADLPLLGDFAETTSVAYQRLYDKTPLMANEHKGYRVLAVFTQPPAFLFSSQSQSASMSQALALPSTVNAAASGTALRMEGDKAKGGGNGEDSQYLIGTTRELQALSGHEKIRTAFMFKGGVANVSYVFALNQSKWNGLSEKDKAALNRISGVEAAGLLGRILDAEEWKANMGVHDAGISFYSPTGAALAQTRQDFATLEKIWTTQAKSAGINNPASLLATFRKGIFQQEDAE